MKNLNNFFIDYFIKNFFKEIKFEKDTVLLDLGCGLMPFRKYYHDRYHKIITGDYEKRREDVDLELDAQNLPFEDNKFDAILFSEVLEHIPEPTKAVEEIARCLKKNGQLIITIPFIYQLHEVPYDYFRYTEFGLEKILKDQGLIIKKILRRGNLFSLFILLSTGFIFNFFELLTRIPVIGKVFSIVKYLIVKILEGIQYLHFRLIRDSKSLNPTSPGDNLKGLHSFASWNLGYCIVASKG